jgi:hypothetical protein
MGGTLCSNVTLIAMLFHCMVQIYGVIDALSARRCVYKPSRPPDQGEVKQTPLTFTSVAHEAYSD